MTLQSLIVKTDSLDCQAASEALGPDFETAFCSDTAAAKNYLEKNHVDLVTVWISGQRSDEAMDFIRWVTAAQPFTPVIAASREDNSRLAVASLKAGACDFIVHPFAAGHLLRSAQRAVEERRLKNEIDYLRREQDVVYRFDGIVAECAAMRAVLKSLEKFAATDATILMTGETGTGKSFLSGTLHFNSPRRRKPFVKINCANLPETLLESELFGHEKGAFTGADKQRVGRFEQAEGGTIFLDEIGEMSMGLQAKLLRVLEDKAFERLGGVRTLHSDVRVIAATNRHLEQMISEGRFRKDLYYRINILQVHLPPLRERTACIEPMATTLLTKICRSLKKHVKGFDPEVMRWFLDYSWPGNIRQMANIIERGVILEEGPVLRPGNVLIPEAARPLPPSAAPQPQPPPAFQPLNPSPETERELIVKALEQTLWIQKDAAQILGVSPRTLNYKVKKFGITHPRWRRNRN